MEDFPFPEDFEAPACEECGCVGVCVCYYDGSDFEGFNEEE